MSAISSRYPFTGTTSSSDNSNNDQSSTITTSSMNPVVSDDNNKQSTSTGWHPKTKPSPGAKAIAKMTARSAGLDEEVGEKLFLPPWRSILMLISSTATRCTTITRIWMGQDQKSLESASSARKL